MSCCTVIKYENGQAEGNQDTLATRTAAVHTPAHSLAPSRPLKFNLLCVEGCNGPPFSKIRADKCIILIKRLIGLNERCQAGLWGIMSIEGACDVFVNRLNDHVVIRMKHRNLQDALTDQRGICCIVRRPSFVVYRSFVATLSRSCVVMFVRCHRSN